MVTMISLIIPSLLVKLAVFVCKFTLSPKLTSTWDLSKLFDASLPIVNVEAYSLANAILNGTSITETNFLLPLKSSVITSDNSRLLWLKDCSSVGRTISEFSSHIVAYLIE